MLLHASGVEEDLAPAPSSAYGDAEAVYHVGEAIAPNRLVWTGPRPPLLRYRVSPALPAGLALDAATGAISGAPLVEIRQTKYKVRAESTYEVGAAEWKTNLRLAVANPPPSLHGFERPVCVHVRGVESAPNALLNAGGGPSRADVFARPAGFFAVEPALPAGLSFDPATGSIRGTPTQAAAPRAYTVSAANFGGNDSAAIVLAVRGGVEATAAGGAALLGGPRSGGTLVTLRTDATDASASLSPHCAVGGKEVPATWAAGGVTGELACATPPHSAGIAALSVSLGGRGGNASVLASGSVAIFVYYDAQTSWADLEPSVSELSLSSTKTVQLEWRSSASCPTPSPSEFARTRVVDDVGLFDLRVGASVPAECRIGVQCCVQCALPGVDAMQLRERTARLWLSLNAQQYHPVDAPVRYRASVQPTLRSVSPPAIAAGTASLLTLDGADFSSAATCHVELVCEGELRRWNATSAEPGRLDAEMRCAVDAAFVDDAACVVRVSAQNEGGEQFRSDALDVALFELPVVSRVEPELVARDGGSRITIHGRGLARVPSAGGALVSFSAGSAVEGTVAGSVVNGTTVVAVTPVLSGGTVAVRVALNGGQFSGAAPDAFRTFGAMSVRPRSLPAGREVDVTVALAALSGGADASKASWRCLFCAGRVPGAARVAGGDAGRRARDAALHEPCRRRGRGDGRARALMR